MTFHNTFRYYFPNTLILHSRLNEQLY